MHSDHSNEHAECQNSTPARIDASINTAASTSSFAGRLSFVRRCLNPALQFLVGDFVSSRPGLVQPDSFMSVPPGQRVRVQLASLKLGIVCSHRWRGAFAGFERELRICRLW
jgi:hypothetical protein